MVILFLGSKSDLAWGTQITGYLEKFGLKYKIHIASAHKTPDNILKKIKSYEKRYPSLVYICIAGRSNALGGFVDFHTANPVINCPPESSKYAGLDILSSLRMPSGVAPLTVLEPDQAALSAAKILGLKTQVRDYQKNLRLKIQSDDNFLQKKSGRK